MLSFFTSSVLAILLYLNNFSERCKHPDCMFYDVF